MSEKRNFFVQHGVKRFSSSAISHNIRHQTDGQICLRGIALAHVKKRGARAGALGAHTRLSQTPPRAHPGPRSASEGRCRHELGRRSVHERRRRRRLHRERLPPILGLAATDRRGRAGSLVRRTPARSHPGRPTPDRIRALYGHGGVPALHRRHKHPLGTDEISDGHDATLGAPGRVGALGPVGARRSSRSSVRCRASISGGRCLRDGSPSPSAPPPGRGAGRPLGCGGCPRGTPSTARRI